MVALIQQLSPNTMQSGTNGANRWVIQFPKQMRRTIDPLTGNAVALDMLQELDLNFDTKDDAITYAKSNSIAFRLIEKPKHKPVGRSYSDNFAYERKFPWTH